ncbi:PH domain-containing protein [Novosphingobium sp. BL-52-GroH]|uniref:PH domain-containing protein n=1 Tax=Novosphingobium sp. BL-52-GroH TaxID=3349877 RepID=UPI0038516EE4
MIDFKNGTFFKLKQSGEYASMVADLLIPGESVLNSFRAMRDGVVFTDKRVIAVNVQGITGKKRDFTSLPYSKIVAFSVETAGTLDLDAELELYFSGLGKVKFDFTGKTNIVEIAKVIGAFVL